MWYRLWLYVYFTWLHRMLKWVLRKATGKCELVRICCSDYPKGGRKTKAIENSLKHSKLGALKRILVDDELNVNDAVNYTMAVKGIDPKMYPEFGPSLKGSLKQICGYRALLHEVETLKRESYCCNNPSHEQDLIKLWRLLQPNSKLEGRITKKWGEVGFQGDDPATDFRGMGVLGLHNLVFFAENYNGVAVQVLTHSHHPTLGYSYAIVGINLTSMAYNLLKNGALKSHFYNAVTGEPCLYHFHRVYCYIFSEFDRFWFAENPKNVMEFGRLRDKFEMRLIEKLKEPGVVLQNSYVGC